mmetsp:Transcript_26784/g.74864  ORF Transcript_26784/g.74864 Transcript_26784/m.74864 type:complete len:115 (-) Transcript_26784:26-370(-)|eukprot:CAMPEP_0119130772 /NCGR_PEP_ID=MMETSP1310-20130426/8690_1 /TAXON_ID=464262 /ORGANISM="Genus nov. species nov., Strain RCC2339" /LENGTH=114 /DNA_ID=CAMNT_0007121303 /DNA_START=121 /DNA_END=465 /DNA_ORIENTATION=-
MSGIAVREGNQAWTLDDTTKEQCEKVCHKSSVYIGKLGNEPSIGLYQIQKHVRTSTSSYQPVKRELARMEKETNDALIDLDYATMTLRDWSSISSFDNIKESLLSSIATLEGKK